MGKFQFSSPPVTNRFFPWSLPYSVDIPGESYDIHYFMFHKEIEKLYPRVQIATNMIITGPFGIFWEVKIDYWNQFKPIYMGP